MRGSLSLDFGLATLAWAEFSLGRFESGWAAALIGVLALVAIGVVLARQRSTRDLGLGLFLGLASVSSSQPWWPCWCSRDPRQSSTG